MKHSKYFTYTYNKYGYLVSGMMGILNYLRMNSFEAIIIGNNEIVTIAKDEINVLWTRGHSIRSHLSREGESFVTNIATAAGLHSQLSKIQKFTYFPFTSYEELKNQKGLIRINCDISEQVRQII